MHEGVRGPITQAHDAKTGQEDPAPTPPQDSVPSQEEISAAALTWQPPPRRIRNRLGLNKT